ncbi:NAD-dependent epimerase/dehydratase family protein [Zavarzinia compransoris]|uniref:Dihydroflavonol 4-reductase n=1 Tax=Zavarzinia compransoris TaxID=1264899 RepID=A0A317E7E6_9PROT|nr:NAD-dependent epimerase/dehydratase family protein [Zavarzinia compransoris]PWR22204.1 dihydroflavonol 4-reductase [Zavarzinia compransoris]TDP47043.1 nucleoside-diphosphate-sugar epimerase [Zavarzinia compransoris]
MKIFVTGATGFVGAHTARALLEAGHDLRLLARDPAALRRYFARFGQRVDDIVEGDMRDAPLVGKAMAGCDAVFHAAALVSVDPKRADEIYRNNIAGIDAVLGTACRLGIGRIVYVSSLSVLFQKGVTRIDEATPLGTPANAYARSKRDCDAHVRRLQAAGRPIQMTYPAGIFGPDDPKLSEANHGVTAFVKVVPRTSTGLQAIDVRDLAAVHRHLLEHPAEGDYTAARFIVGGRYYPWAAFRRLLQGLTGRRIPAPPLPGALMRAMGGTVDLIRRIVPFETQVSGEAMTYVTRWAEASSARILARTGMAFRTGEETFGDTIRWLVAAGHLDARHAGRLAA